MAIGGDAKIQLVILAQNQMGAAFTSAGSMIQGLESKAKATTGILAGLGSKLAGFASAVAVGFLGKTGMQLNMQMEQTQMAFETMLGSAEKAAAFVTQLKNMAAKTPFEFPGLADTSRKLMAFGFVAEEIPKMLTAIGDAASGLGIGAFGMERISIALGQIRAKSKIQAQEMLQLTEAGVPAWEILAKAMGKSTAEVMKLSEKGLIPAKFAIDALVQGMADKFPNMMKKQSGTGGGIFSTLMDNSKRFLAAGMTPLMEGFKLLGGRLSNWMTPAVEQFERRMEQLKPTFREVWNLASNLFSRLGDLFRGFWAVAGGSSVAGSKAKGFAEAMRRALTIVKEVNQELQRLRPTFEGIGQFFGAIAVVIKSQVEVAFIGLKTTLKVIADLLNGDFSKAWSDLKQGASDMGIVMNDLDASLKPLPGSMQAIAIALGSIGTVLLGGAAFKGLQTAWKAVVGAIGGTELGAALSLTAGAVWRFITSIGKAGAFGALVSEIGTLLGMAGRIILAAVGGWPALVVVGLVAIATAVAVYWDDIVRWTSNMWTSVKQWWSDGVTTLGNNLTEWKTAFTTWASETWDGIAQWFMDLPLKLVEKVGYVAGWLSVTIPEKWTAFKDWLGETLTATKKWFEELPGKLVGAVLGVGIWLAKTVPAKWDAFKTWISTTSKNLTDWLSGLPGEFQTWLSLIPEKIGNLAKQFAAKGKEMAVAFAEAFTKGLGEIGKWVMEGIEGIKNYARKAADAFNAGFSSGASAASNSAVTIKPHADGGIFTGPTLIGSHLFGEAGPEALIPLTPSNALRYGLSGGSSPSVVVYANGNITRNERELGEIVARVIMDRLKLQKQFAL